MKKLFLDPTLKKNTSIKHHFQKSGITCGPASLKMALSTYGYDLEEDYLKDICQTGRVTSGTESLDLALGIQLLGGKVIVKNNSSIKELEGFLNKGWRIIIGYGYGHGIIGHYSVLTDIKDGKIFIYDPAKGPNTSYTNYYFENKMWNLGSHKDGSKMFIAFKL